MALAGIAMLNACSDDDPVPGNPTMDFQAEPSSALFGDSLPFTIKASDADVPLSTLKARLYFSDEMVSETIIRTKVNGQDYTGKIYVPYLANIPNGTATLKFILQNINFTITAKSYDVALSRPDFPYLTLISGDQEYRMEKVAANQYSVTGEFAQKVKGYIKAPKVGANGMKSTSDGATVPLHKVPPVQNYLLQSVSWRIFHLLQYVDLCSRSLS